MRQKVLFVLQDGFKVKSKTNIAFNMVSNIGNAQNQ